MGTRLCSCPGSSTDVLSSELGYLSGIQHHQPEQYAPRIPRCTDSCRLAFLPSARLIHLPCSRADPMCGATRLHQERAGSATTRHLWTDHQKDARSEAGSRLSATPGKIEPASPSRSQLRAVTGFPHSLAILVQLIERLPAFFSRRMHRLLRPSAARTRLIWLTLTVSPKRSCNAVCTCGLGVRGDVRQNSMRKARTSPRSLIG